MTLQPFVGDQRHYRFGHQQTQGHIQATISSQRHESDGIVAFLSFISLGHFVNTSLATLLAQ